MFENLWRDDEAEALAEAAGPGGRALALRVYSSRLVGRVPDLVMHGGGNTSIKLTARDVFGEVDEALGQSLLRLMSDGPPDELQLTENAQPAIMANAVATLRVLERDAGIRLADKADYVAGHSLGEYSALCAAQSLDLPTTFLAEGKLVQLVFSALADGAVVAEMMSAMPTAAQRLPEWARVNAGTSGTVAAA